jgi:tetratricopeptide (TPR) repeat protein
MTTANPSGWPALRLGPIDLRPHRREIVISLGLVLLTVAALGGACGNDFVNYDDDVYVTQNWSVLGGLDFDTVAWAFTATVSNHWHPLTWLSLQFDVGLFGPVPWGFHLTNLLLHTANVLLLFVVLRQMTGAVWRSAAVAALFAVHPLHVESVAWVTERKDVLSAFFWLLTTLAYVRYVRQPGWRRYRWVLAFFVLGLLSKSMVLTLPCVLLLLDYWPLGRIGWQAASGPPSPGVVTPGLLPHSPSTLRWLVWEKLPLFALSLAAGVMSLYARQKGGGLKSGEYLGLGERLGYAVNAYATYLGKCLWPADLAAFYPLAPGGLPAWQVAAAAGLLVALTALVLVAARRRPYLAVGWLWYLVTLLPVSGVVQLGSYALADRYAYIPSVGLFVLAVWGVADLASRPARVWVLAPVVGLVLLAFVLLCREQVATWRDSVTLWRHALAVTPDNFFVRLKLGQALREVNDLDGAAEQFTEAVRLRPDLAKAHDMLGAVRLQQGRVSEAVDCFTEATEMQPAAAEFQRHLGQALQKQGSEEQAQKRFQLAEELTARLPRR